MKKFSVALAVFSMAAALAAIPPLASAQGHAGHGAPAGAKMAGTADGEVRRIDAAGKKLVIKHGDFKGMDMPAMTMAFPVKDAKMLDGLKPGDRIKFAVEQSGGDLVITKIDKAK
jgi:Cu/Ag efflux protein CusF